jgi:RNA polymerase sigma-70 factor (ECF subfamily)
VRPGKLPSRTVSKISSKRVPHSRGLLRVISVGLFAPTAATPIELRIGARGERLIINPRRRVHRDQFDNFYRSHYPSVTRLAYSLCGSMAIAEELAQEAFVAAHRRWRRVAGFDRPDLWVRRVVINRSISYRRKLASERKALKRVSEHPDRINEPVLADEVIWQAMRELSARQAEVLALVYVEDQPIAAVAEILGLGEETVRTHLKRGKAALAMKLADDRREVGP